MVVIRFVPISTQPQPTQGRLAGRGRSLVANEHFVILSLRFQDPKGSPVPKAIILQLFCFSCVLDGQELESEPRAGNGVSPTFCGIDPGMMTKG